MTRKGLLEALLGVAYEDDVVEETAPTTQPTQPSTISATSTAAIPAPPADVLTAPTRSTAISDSLSVQPIPAAPIAKTDGSIEADPEAETIAATAATDAPSVHDGRSSTIAVARVGMLGGLLGLLEEDFEQANGADLEGAAITVPVKAVPRLGETEAQPNTTVDESVVTEESDANPLPTPDTQRLVDNLMPDAVVEGGQGRVAATITNPPPPPLGLAEAKESSPTAASFVLPPPPAPSASITANIAAATDAPETGTADLPLPNDLTQLREDLDSFDLHRRRRALRALLAGPLTGDIISIVAKSVGDPEVDLRHLALQVLERAPELISAAMLHGVAFDPDPTVRARAVALAGRNTNPSMVTAIVSCLVEETDENVIANGLDALAALARATDLADTHIDDLCRAVATIARQGHEGVRKNIQFLARTVAIGDIVHRLARKDADIRAGAAVLAAEAHDEDADHALSRLVADSDPVVRQFAAVTVARQSSATSGITEVSGDTGTPDRAGNTNALLLGLLSALDDPKPAIRTQATDALQRLPKAHIVDAVVELSRLADSTQLVRLFAAAKALSLEESAPALANAVIRVADGRLPKRLHDAALQLPSVAEVGQLWRSANSSAQRCAGTRLVALLEYPQSATAINDALSDPFADVRVTAAELAGELDVSDAVADGLVLLAASDDSPQVSLAAIAALATASPQRRVDAAKRATASIDADVRAAALDLLAVDDDASVAILMRALRDDNEHVVRLAATMLLQGDFAETLATLWNLVRETIPHRDVIIEVLRTVDEGALRRLALDALHSSDPTDRIAAVAGIAGLSGRHYQDLAGVMSDVDARVRRAAIDALSQDTGEDVTAVALRAMDDPEASVRARAAAVLIRSDDESALKRGIGALDDTSVEVREAVAQAARDTRSTALIELLMTELDRPAHQAVAAELLVTRNDVADLLCDELVANEQDESRQAVLVDALRSAGHTKRLIEELRHQDPSVRQRALRRLGPLAGAEEVTAVADRLSDPDPNVRIDAAHLLKFIGGPEAGQALQNAFASDPNMDVVAAIEQAYRTMINDG
ncbi:MAG: HEAT repeat domain-containing protein [Nitriliruptoraceae bacterium]